jgi:beta-lactamase regulating signal transducer with metallopeptidase domain
MIDPFGSTILGTRAALVALDVILKATAMMALVFAVHGVLGRRRAAARSALWNACLVGLLLLPAASLAFPRLRLAVLSPWPEIAARVERPEPIAGPTILPEHAAAVRTGPAADRPATVVMAHPALGHGTSAPVAPPATVPRPGGVDIAMGVYLTVAAWLGIRLIVAMAAVGRLRRRCGPVADIRWTEALDRWRARLGVARRVAMLETDRVSIPIVVGWLRPAIIVPRAPADAADPVVIDAVLLHELGHVRRGDFGWNLVRKVVQLAYWPHPLIWLAGRAIAAVREQACDDLCVHGLGGADAYRRTLLEVASGLARRPDPALGLAMARATNLGRRLAWIDRTRGASRCVLRWPARLAIAIVMMAAAGVLGAVELSRAPLRAAEPPRSTPMGPRMIDVIVRAQDTGKPIEGATVRALINMERVSRKTDRDGRARILLFQHQSRDSLNMDVWAEGYVQQRHFFSQNDARYPKIPEQFAIELFPGTQTLGGTVNDEQGRPIQGVKVEIWGYLGEKKQKDELAWMVDATTDDQGRWRCRCFRNMTFAYLFLSHPDYLSDGDGHARRHGQPTPDSRPGPDDRPLQALRDFSDVQVMTRGVEISGEVRDEQGTPIEGAEVGWIETRRKGATFHGDMPTTTTDAQGRFRFPHVRPGSLVAQVKARGYAPELATVTAREQAEPVTVRLKPARRLEGRVVDRQGRPIDGAFVVIDTWRTFRSLGVFLWTDDDGRFRWEDAPADEVLVNATRSGFEYAAGKRARAGEPVVIPLQRVVSISGRIRDAATRKGVGHTEVAVGVPDPNTGRTRWQDRPAAFANQGFLQANVEVEETPEFRLRIRAKGYEPFESRTFRSDEGQVEYDVPMKKLDGPLEVPVSGTVLRPDGKPLADAEVAIAYPLEDRKLQPPMVSISNGRLLPKVVSTATTPRGKTDDQGRFRLMREPDPKGPSFAIVVVHPEYCAEVGRPAFEADSTIRARPWGRIEGVARIGAKPAAGETILYFAHRRTDFDVPDVSDAGKTSADPQGRFVFEHVLPGEVEVARSLARGGDGGGQSNGVVLDVKAGETARAEVGGRGRPVMATVAVPPGFEPQADMVTYAILEIESEGGAIPHVGPPPGPGRSDPEKVRKGLASAEGREHRRADYYTAV